MIEIVSPKSDGKVIDGDRRPSMTGQKRWRTPKRRRLFRNRSQLGSIKYYGIRHFYSDINKVDRRPVVLISSFEQRGSSLSVEWVSFRCSGSPLVPFSGCQIFKHVWEKVTGIRTRASIDDASLETFASESEEALW